MKYSPRPPSPYPLKGPYEHKELGWGPHDLCRRLQGFVVNGVGAKGCKDLPPRGLGFKG